MDQLTEYLKKVITICHHSITFSGDKSNTLNRWIVKSEWIDNPESNGVAPCLSAKGQILRDRDVVILPREEFEINWRYYIADSQYFLGEQRTFYEYNHFHKLFATDEDKYIYSLCNVYCNETRAVNIFIFAISPIKLWINGQLVFISNYGYHIRPYCFIYQFQQGDNSVLVEQTSFAKNRSRNLNPAEFTIKIQPCDLLLDEQFNHFFDKQLMVDFGNQYLICPDWSFYGPQQQIKIIILPRYFRGTQAEPVKVIGSDVNGSIIIDLNTFTGQQLNLDINPQITGVLLIKAASTTNPAQNSNIHIFRGDFFQARDRLIQRARERHETSGSMIDSFIRVTEIPDIHNNCFIKDSPELMLSDFYYLVFEKYTEFERWVNANPNNLDKPSLAVYKENDLIFMNSEIDDGFLAYQICLPQNYTPSKKYPLFIFFFFGFGLSRYPDLVLERYPEKQYFTEAIIVSIPTRAFLNRDYINELTYFNIIANITERFSIDRDRLYIIGSCTGGMEGLGLALKAPHLFSAVACAWNTPRMDLGNPEYDYLKNVDNVTTYHLLNIDDLIMNFSRATDTAKHFAKAKIWNFYNLSHIEADLLIDYRKVIKELMAEKTAKYPKEIQYTLYDPIYNRSFWLMVNYIDDLNHKGVIRAKIIKRDLIEVSLENISCFSLFLNTECMELDHEIEFNVNQIKQMITITDYAMLTIELSDNQLAITNQILEKESFERQFNRIRIDENLLGIKKVYLSKCMIVKSDLSNENNRVLIKKLYHILQQPLRERIRNYKYDLYEESQIDPASLALSNFIYPIDTRNMSDKQQRILNVTGFTINNVRIDYHEHQYSGDYFALLKCLNPYDSQKFALFVIYNSDATLAKLIDFWYSFDNNMLFYSDVVIFYNGDYYSFRDKVIRD